MKKVLLRGLNRVLSMGGVKLVRAEFNGDLESNQTEEFGDIYASDVPQNQIIELQKLSSLSQNIHGMISHRAGEELFSLAYMQELQGDVVEVGSFQGKSTFFLGTAVRASGNGHLFAIDHFKGNVGKESSYVVENRDLSDLESGFRRNIDRAELNEFVTLINKPNNLAVSELEDKTIRLLFIDADHTAEGVAKDLQLFFPKLKDCAIIIFDDYDKVHFNGLVGVVNEFVKEHKVSRKYLLGRTMVVQL